MIELCKKIKTNRKKIFFKFGVKFVFYVCRHLCGGERKRNSVVAKVRKQGF